MASSVRALAALLAIVALGGCSNDGGKSADAALAGSDVVWITICTLRADHLSAYGHGLPTSPEIDALAAQGVLFEKARSQAPWTRASIASMMSGLYPRAVAIEDRGRDRVHRGLLDSFTTLAERMQAAGYSTIGLTANPNANATFGFDQGFDSYASTARTWEEGYDKNIQTGDELVDDLLGQVRELGDDDRLFAHMVLVDAHGPFPRAREILARTGGFRGRGITAVYDAHVRYADLVVGDLRRKLEALGRGDTLLLITSDHGQGFGSPNRHDIGHGNYLYDTTLHVPLVLHHPKLASAAKRIAEPVEVLDAVPTILDLVGIEYDPASLDGRSLAPAILGAEPLAPYEESVVETAFGFSKKAAILADGWKLIVDYGDINVPPKPTPTFELYDLTADPGETDDRAAAESERVAELFRRLIAWQERVEARAPAEPLVVEVSGSELEALRALGYLGD